MSLSLSRREILLTQLCSLKYADTDLVSCAVRQLPRILEVLNLEPTDPTEICNLLLELQISRTEIALKTYIVYLSERKSSFRFFPVRGLWTQRVNGAPHLILHLRGNFQEEDAGRMVIHPDFKHILEGPYTYIFSPPVVTDDWLMVSLTESFIKSMFLPRDHEAIYKFFLEEIPE